jgi:ectoine hydroxylase-related dioxygenase (phytanoyl-CoA dioxygenase family)
MPVTLTPAQVEEYHEKGYIVVEGVLSPEKLATLREETDKIIAAASSVTENDALYDLEDSHTASNPRVRRIKEPYHHVPYFWNLTVDTDVTNIVAQLLGPNLRVYGGKMNMKAAGYGAPVEWHQDWAFYPHTNDDVLATGMLLDDCDEANGPLMVVPGSHKGPVHDHHHDGAFCGAFDPEAEKVDLSSAEKLMGPAGSMTIHHVRAVHGSAMNTSNRQRRLLLTEYAAADAWPLANMKGDFDAFESRMVRGVSTSQPRMAPVPVRMPFPAAKKQGSIYENQKGTGRRYFDTFESKTEAAE